MWTLSGFVDEISPDFTEQRRMAADFGLTYVELRSAWDTGILDLKANQLAAMKETLYAILRPHLEYVQIKDARAADGTVVTAGNGDGEVAQTMRALHHDGFDGFLLKNEGVEYA